MWSRARYPNSKSNLTEAAPSAPQKQQLTTTINSSIMPQDMPPTGGYDPVQYKRNLPARGFRPSVYLLGVGLVMTYGFWKIGKGIREHKYVMSTQTCKIVMVFT
jgi:hypothetical protein